MTAAEIEALVKDRADIPEDLNIAEICYYTTLEGLRGNRCPHAEKPLLYQRAREAFEKCQRWIAIYQNTCRMRVEIAMVSKTMTNSDCPICKRAIAIFDGRIDNTYENHSREHSDDGRA